MYRTTVTVLSEHFLPLAGRCHVDADQLPRRYPSASSLSPSPIKRFEGLRCLMRYLNWCKWTTVYLNFPASNIHNSHSNHLKPSTRAFNTFKQVFYKTFGRYAWNFGFATSCRFTSIRSRCAKFVAEGEWNISLPFCLRFSLALLDCARVHCLPFLCCNGSNWDRDRPCHRGRAVFEGTTNFGKRWIRKWHRCRCCLFQNARVSEHLCSCPVSITIHFSYV